MARRRRPPSCSTFREQQRKDGPGPYSFRRTTSVAYDTVPLGGYGNPTRPVGLIHSAFRPSDDACVFPFLVPSNLFAVVSLRQLAEISEPVTKDAAFARECRALADEVAAALALHALVAHPRHGTVWAYEVDGFGNALFMDDANVPSLLALPYLGCGTAGGPGLREHPPARALGGQPVLLPREGGRGRRRAPRRAAHDLAARDHDAGAHQHERRRGRSRACAR